MTGRTGLRKRKEAKAKTLQKKRKMPRRSVKKKETMGFCEINGTMACETDKKVKLVKFDGCNCKRLCMACARAWLKNSSTCPFCRAQVSLVNNIDVEYKRQREDHDVEQPCFRFPYTDWLGNTAVFQANVETSRLFANRRAKHKLPKEILFMVKVVESLDIEIVHDNAFYTFVVRKLFNYRGRRKQVLYRILFYFAMHERNPVAFFFLMTLLRKTIQRRQGIAPSTFFDMQDDSVLEISKGIFHDVPDECLFCSSALDIYKRNTETHHWHLLFHPLCLLYPQHALELRVGFIEPPSEDDSDDDEDYGDFFRVVFVEGTPSPLSEATTIRATTPSPRNLLPDLDDTTTTRI